MWFFLGNWCQVTKISFPVVAWAYLTLYFWRKPPVSQDANGCQAESMYTSTRASTKDADKGILGKLFAHDLNCEHSVCQEDMKLGQHAGIEDDWGRFGILGWGIGHTVIPHIALSPNYCVQSRMMTITNWVRPRIMTITHTHTDRDTDTQTQTDTHTAKSNYFLWTGLL